MAVCVLHVLGSSGQYLLAAPYGGTMYQSSNGGTTWVAVTANFPGATSRNFRAVSINAEGKYMAAVVGDFGGTGSAQLIYSADYGGNWQLAGQSTELLVGIAVAVSLAVIDIPPRSGAIWAAAQNGQVFRYTFQGNGNFGRDTIAVVGTNNGDWRDIATNMWAVPYPTPPLGLAAR